ncbi:hypothetical protein CXF81_06370 [Glaciecola sp. 33A]|nr:hypothetical protein CXF81_06370 [Glaciecola sp. 33A]
MNKIFLFIKNFWINSEYTTFVRTYEGFLYLAIVIDLCTRHVVGWPIDKNILLESCYSRFV